MNTIETVDIKKIKPNPDNPRFIKDESFKKLVKSLKEFPEMIDARPIVVNMDWVILGGNMRYRALREIGATETKVMRVDWSEDKQKEFVIKDNVSGGEWDWDLLANEWDVDLLRAWGVDMPFNDAIDDLQDNEEIEFEQSVQLEPPMEYIILLAEPNSEEWEEIKQLLQLKMVRKGGYKKGSDFDAVGLERVLRWNDFTERLNANSDSK